MTPQEFWRVADTIRKSIDDLEELESVIASVRETDKRENWILAYLREKTTLMVMFANKRNDIQKLIIEDCEKLNAINYESI